jgi:hypothetical protein
MQKIPGRDAQTLQWRETLIIYLKFLSQAKERGRSCSSNEAVFVLISAYDIYTEHFGLEQLVWLSQETIFAIPHEWMSGEERDTLKLDHC